MEIHDLNEKLVPILGRPKLDAGFAVVSVDWVATGNAVKSLDRVVMRGIGLSSVSFVVHISQMQCVRGTSASSRAIR